MRCTSCNKFVPFSYDEEPELEGDLDFSVQSCEWLESGEISVDLEVVCTVRLVNTCEECGQEMAEAHVDLQDIVVLNIPASAAKDLDPATITEDDFEISEDGCDREDYYKGKGRRPKHMHRVTVNFSINGPGSTTVTSNLSDEISASEFEEIQ